MARLIDAARLRGHDVMVRVWVRLVMPCCALSSALTALLRELVKTARADGFLAFVPVSAACGLLFSSPMCLLGGGRVRLVSCVSLVLDTHIAPPLRHEGRGDIFPVSVAFSVRSY